MLIVLLYYYFIIQVDNLQDTDINSGFHLCCYL